MNDAEKLQQIEELLQRWKSRRLAPETALVSIYNTVHWNKQKEGELESFPIGGPFLVEHLG